MFFIVIYKYIEKYIGGADLLIFALLMTRYGFYISIEIIFYASVIAYIYALVLKIKTLKFIPFIFIGYILKVVIKWK